MSYDDTVQYRLLSDRRRAEHLIAICDITHVCVRISIKHNDTMKAME